MFADSAAQDVFEAFAKWVGLMQGLVTWSR